MSSASLWTLVVDHGDHISETRHDTRAEAIAYLRNGYTYGLLEGVGYTQAQLDALEPDQFRALLAERGMPSRIIDPTGYEVSRL
ncbi:hypothetical protein ABQF34_15130 [Mycolicibacterium boenickei]